MPSGSISWNFTGFAPDHFCKLGHRFRCGVTPFYTQLAATLTVFGLPPRAGPRLRTSAILPQLIHAVVDLYQSVRCSFP
uniref:Uncharacterized protein n=1 Tax=Salmonella phage vB_STmST313_KE27 TaxID=3161178 RepID=A0AAU8GGN8_9CAUD